MKSLFPTQEEALVIASTSFTSGEIPTIEALPTVLSSRMAPLDSLFKMFGNIHTLFHDPAFSSIPS
jgi:hypothetical protein